MRMLSVGHRFEDEAIEETSFSSSRTFLEHDVVVLDLSDLVSLDAQTSSLFQGLTCLTESASARLYQAMERRLKEMRALLQGGRTIVLFAPHPENWNFDTGRREYSGTGRNARTVRIYEERGIDGFLPLKLSLHAAQGDRVEVRGGEPFASFLRATKGMYSYASYVEDFPGTPTLFIAGTNHVVGGVVPVEQGTVVVLPKLGRAFVTVERTEETLYEEDEPELYEVQAVTKEFSDALTDLLTRLTTEDEVAFPEWSLDYLVAWEKDAVEALNTAETELARLEEETGARRDEITRLRARKLLFTGSGRPLERQVAESFEALGCQVQEGEPGRDDLIITWHDKVAVVEVKGLGKSGAEKNAAQLEKWVSEYYEEHDVRPKGILVVNAWSNTPLSERTADAFPPQMLQYSTNREHCLLTGLQLLAARAEGDADPSKRDQIVESIFECIGVYPDYADWSAFVEEAAVKDGR